MCNEHEDYQLSYFTKKINYAAPSGSSIRFTSRSSCSILASWLLITSSSLALTSTLELSLIISAATELLSLGGGGGILERSREMDLLSRGFDLDLLSPAFDLELLSPDFDADDLCVRSRDTE